MAVRGLAVTPWLFIHVPKTAGNSIMWALGLDPENPADFVHGHNTRYEDYIFFKNTVRYRDQFTFCFVRNPWDRVVSAYHYLQAGGLNEDDARDARQFVAPHTHFKQFVRRGRWKSGLLQQIHFRPQYEWCVSRRGALPDFVGRFENLQADFNHVCERIGIEPVTLPHSNKAKHAHYSKYYDRRTSAIVAKYYRKDIDYFGYTF